MGSRRSSLQLTSPLQNTPNMTPSLPPDISDLRRRHYNATVTRRRLVNDELVILRVRPDGGVPIYEAGQYTTLGLGYWEPRASGCDAEHLAEALQTRLAQRAEPDRKARLARGCCVAIADP